jgi:hypothetical protein
MAELVQAAVGDEVQVQHTQRTNKLRPLRLRAGNELWRPNVQPAVTMTRQRRPRRPRHAAQPSLRATMTITRTDGPLTAAQTRSP